MSNHIRLGPPGAMLLAAVVVLTTALPPLGDSATAACTNYENYLHWVNTTEFDRRMKEIVVRDDVAYVAEAYGDSWLRIFDVSNDSAPAQVDSVLLPSEVQNIAMAGDYVAASNQTGAPGALTIVDVSDPENASVVGYAWSGYSGWDVAMTETVVYMVHKDYPYHSLTITDISNPDSLVEYPEVVLPTQPSDGIILRGNYVYIGGNDLMTVNVSNPGSAFVCDTDHVTGGQLRDIAVSGNYIFASLRRDDYTNARLVSFSLSSPNNPQVKSQKVTQFPGGSIYPRLDVSGDIAYIGWSTAYVWMFDVSNPTNMQELGHLPHMGGNLHDLAVFGHNLYRLENDVVTGTTGRVHTISISSPSPRERLGSVLTPGDARAVVVEPTRGGLAYVADGPAGVLVVDVADPEHPTVVDTIDTPGYALDLVLADSLVYVADGPEGLQVLNTNTRQVIGSAATPDTAVAVDVADTLAFLAATGSGLRVISVSDPTAPLELGAEETILLNSRGVDVSGTIAYVADGAQGVQAVDVSEPDDPWVIGGVRGRAVADARSIDVRFDRAYVTDAGAGLVILDLTYPDNMQELSRVATDDVPGDLDVMGIFAFVGSGDGMHLVDIQDDLSPTIVGGMDMPQTARGIFANEDYAYIATGDSLLVCPMQCGFNEAVIAGFTMSSNEGLCPLPIDFTNESEGYGMSYDWDFGDGIGTSTAEDPTYTYTEAGDYIVTLTTTNGIDVDVAAAGVTAQSEPPTMKAVTDIPEDIGGWVYLDFYHSVYDDDGLNRLEVYTIQRRDNGEWVSLNTIGAYGEHYYKTEARTLCDGVACTTAFRIIAHMDEGNWASEPLSGYSEVNATSDAPELVAELELGRAIPNPFNPATTISYALPVPCHVRLLVYDVAGRLVRTLVDAERPPGRHQAIWTGRDDGGHVVASGVYFYEMEAGDKTLRRTMTLLK